MEEKSRSNPSIDPQLMAMLAKLQPTPERDPQVAAAAQARFLSEFDALENSHSPASASLIGFWGRTSQRIKEFYIMMTQKQRFALTIVAIVLAAAVVLFGGATATVSAAQDALPGDALYPVKTMFEQSQVKVAGDTYNQAQMFLGFAELRLEEIDALISERRYEDISTAVDEYEYYIQQAIESMGKLAVNDPERAKELTSRIMDSLSRYSMILAGMLSQVPESVQHEMERAIEISRSGFSSEQEEQHSEELEITGVIESIVGDVWVVASYEILVTMDTEIDGSFVVGDQVRVHVYEGDDGMLMAREIGQAMLPVDDTNDNGDDDANDNADDYGNDNDANDNGDDYGNDNDANDNGDDGDHNGDDGGNHNGDDGGNDNGDDNGDDDGDDNGDDDSNDNGDDDNGDNDANDNGDDDGGDNGEGDMNSTARFFIESTANIS